MKYINLIILVFLFFGANAQKEIVNEEINITKDREIEIQKANRISDKIQPLPIEKKKNELPFNFFDKTPQGIKETSFSPNIINPILSKNNDEEVISYNNYLKAGIGNFGRLFGEIYINSNQNQPLVWGVYGFHNSTKRGPIANENSGASNNKIRLDGKYQLANNQIKLDLGFERRSYGFYGYDTTIFRDYTKANLLQRNNIFTTNLTFDNTNPQPSLDYTVTTGIRNLTDHYKASELDWGTKLHTYFPIVEDKVTALLDAEAYLTQRSDSYLVNTVRKRNLYRVTPSFRFDLNRFSINLGFKAVNDYDQVEKINLTKGYPTVSVSYKLPSLVYFFAGFDGDIIRNTLYSFVTENPYIVPQISLLNTYKPQEFYLGSRGDLVSGFNYNLKLSYGKYQNLYFFTKYDGTSDSPDLTNGVARPLSITKFEATYDPELTQFGNASLEVGFNGLDFWKPTLKADYYYYETKLFAKPIQKPNFVGRMGNTFAVSEKLVANLDFYVVAEQYGYDVNVADPIKLNNIFDLNTEVTYLFSKHFSTFVKINNILNKNYQMYYNYPQLGLNFLAGINVAF